MSPQHESTHVMTAATCPFLFCLVAGPHTHPICPACGAVRYGNAFCDVCRDLRDDNPNPHSLVTEE